jgi:hypothetical protein
MTHELVLRSHLSSFYSFDRPLSQQHHHLGLFEVAFFINCKYLFVSVLLNFGFAFDGVHGTLLVFQILVVEIVIQLDEAMIPVQGKHAGIVFKSLDSKINFHFFFARVHDPGGLHILLLLLDQLLRLVLLLSEPPSLISL